MRALRAACRRRQLQDRRALTLAQASQQHDLPAGELQRIVMNMRLIHIDLPEAGDLLLDPSNREETEGRLAFDIPLKCKLSAGKQANDNVRIFF
jgi:hypothetical protein